MKNDISYDLGAAGLRFERDGAIGWCVIDRPAARNALTPAMYYGIKRAVHLVNEDPGLAALIITGTGDVFAPGGDLGGRSEPGDDLPAGLTGEDVLPFAVSLPVLKTTHPSSTMNQTGATSGRPSVPVYASLPVRVPA